MWSSYLGSNKHNITSILWENSRNLRTPRARKVSCVMNLLSPAWHGLKVITWVAVYGEIGCDVCKYVHAVMNGDSLMTWMCAWKREKRERFHAKTCEFHAKKSSFFIHDLIPNEYLWLRVWSSSIYPSCHPQVTHTWRGKRQRGSAMSRRSRFKTKPCWRFHNSPERCWAAPQVVHDLQDLSCLCSVCCRHVALCMKNKRAQRGRHSFILLSCLAVKYKETPFRSQWKVNTAALCNK